MLDYQWANPSTVIFSTEDNTFQEPNQSPQNFEPYLTTPPTATCFNPNAHFAAAVSLPARHHHYHHRHNPFTQTIDNNKPDLTPSLHDPCVYSDASTESSYPAAHASVLCLEPVYPTGFIMPKSEPVVGGFEFSTGATSRIGLNLGGRTYFTSCGDDFVNRLYRRPRMVERGLLNSPKCQAEGCNADLSRAKQYHRRHKVCEFHSKAATVIAAGLTQRFCQQCSRFHMLSEFDNGKRSCRKRLADHNRRRRKTQQPNQQEHVNKSHEINKPSNSSSENLTKPVSARFGD